MSYMQNKTTFFIAYKNALFRYWKGITYSEREEAFASTKHLMEAKNPEFHIGPALKEACDIFGIPANKQAIFNYLHEDKT